MAQIAINKYLKLIPAVKHAIDTCGHPTSD